MEKNISRRNFLQQSLTGAAGFLTLPLMSSFKFPANETLRMGVIGMGRKGTSLMRNFMSMDGVKVVAVCDVYGVKRKRAEQILRKYYYEKGKNTDITNYEHYRDVLARKDIDVVVIATQDHWHALIAIEACKAGKDIYLEKPLTFTIKEGKELVHAVRSNNRVLAVGSQQRSDPNFQHAVKMVHNGAIGKLEKVSSNVGPFPKPYNLPVKAVPHDLNWELWLGPNQYVHYNPQLAPPISLDPPKNETLWAQWRSFEETGGGFITDWGAHNFDIGQWGLAKGGPVKIIPPGTEGKNHLTYVYDNGIEMINEEWQQGKGVKFWGSDGWIEVERGGYNASDKELMPSAGKKGDANLPNEMGLSHTANFIHAVRNRKDPIVPVEIGHRSCTTCLLGLIANKLGRPVNWDPNTMYFVDDPEAEKHYHRDYRDGYRL